MTRLSLLAATTLAGCSLALGACSREAEAPPEDNMIIEPMTNDMMTMGNATANGMAAAQSATFAGGDGAQMGSVSMTEGAGGVTLMIEATGMPAGVHGIHCTKRACAK
ncbi:MAG: hypothetical protein M3Q57_09915, partial [Pseudomonadota bacterium]|nr:hypothetical protein [Pseudomonadota bacterium]